MRSMLRTCSLVLVCSLLIASSDAAVNAYGRSEPSPVAAQSSVVTVYPGAYQTPDSGQGGEAVSSPLNTEHGSTTSAVSLAGKNGGVKTKTCLWHSFPGVSGTKTRVTLRFDWTLHASISVEAYDEYVDAAAEYDFRIEYSLNNGSTWTSRVSANDSVYISGGEGSDGRSTDTYGSESIDLPNPSAIDITQIRIRDRIHANAYVHSSYNGFASANTTATVSNIRLEVETMICFDNVPGDHWQGEYFNNATLSGSPSMVRNDGAGFLSLNFDAMGGSPSTACGLGADYFSARWTRYVYFDNGPWRFTVGADNGVRFYVDGQLEIDRWTETVDTNIAVVQLSTGWHQIKLEFFETYGGAWVSLSWAPDCFANVPTDRWRGEYFNNTTLSGSPVMVRNDGAGFINLDFDYISGGSACSVPADYFSARWTRQVYFDGGPWRFRVSADNGVRLYIDGQLKFERWTDTVDTNTYIVIVQLSAGWHEIKLEFFENVGSASVNLSWNSAADCFANVPTGRWRGDYFNNTTLSGSPWLVRDDGADFLNLNFGGASPNAACGLGTDNFSARWTRVANFAEGIYRFSVTGDDGVRLYVDGQLRIDKWFDQGLTTYTADVFLSAGNHEVKLEYYEHEGGAAALLSWADFTNCLANVPASKWRGEYYNNITLTGPVAMVRDDGAGFLNFDFGLGGPGGTCGIGVDGFSARWTRTVNFGSGVYRFSVTGDDGVRLYVDGQVKIDKWLPQGATTYTADVTLSAGAHEVKMEYFESGGPGIALLSWVDLTGVNCLPNVPLPLISSVPQTGSRENIASTAPSDAPKRCGQKIVASQRAPGSN